MKHLKIGEVPARVQPALYPLLLGKSWEAVAPEIPHMHCDGARIERRGVFRIVGARHWVGRVLTWVLRLPQAAENVAVLLVVTPSDGREEWQRDFGGQKMRTVQGRDDHGRMVEWFAGLPFTVRLEERGCDLIYDQERVALAAGLFRIPLSRCLAPLVEGSEKAAADGVLITVKVTLPLIGLLIAYEGKLEL